MICFNCGKDYEGDACTCQTVKEVKAEILDNNDMDGSHELYIPDPERVILSGSDLVEPNPMQDLFKTLSDLLGGFSQSPERVAVKNQSKQLITNLLISIFLGMTGIIPLLKKNYVQAGIEFGIFVATVLLVSIAGLWFTMPFMLFVWGMHVAKDAIHYHFFKKFMKNIVRDENSGNIFLN